MNAATPYSTSAFFEQLRECRRHPSPVPPAKILVECGSQPTVVCPQQSRSRTLLLELPRTGELTHGGSGRHTTSLS